MKAALALLVMTSLLLVAAPGAGGRRRTTPRGRLDASLASFGVLAVK